MTSFAPRGIRERINPLRRCIHNTQKRRNALQRLKRISVHLMNSKRENIGDMTMKELKITSPVFKNNGFIPKKYTCDGDNVNPPLKIGGVSEGTQSIVLIVDDPDTPMGTWDHRVVWNISHTSKIEENVVPGVEGVNDFRKHSYGGPCPPSGTHRYFFKVYALDTKLDARARATNSRKQDVERALAEKSWGFTEEENFTIGIS